MAKMKEAQRRSEVRLKYQISKYGCATLRACVFAHPVFDRQRSWQGFLFCYASRYKYNTSLYLTHYADLQFMPLLSREEIGTRR